MPSNFQRPDPSTPTVTIAGDPVEVAWVNFGLGLVVPADFTDAPVKRRLTEYEAVLEVCLATLVTREQFASSEQP